MCQSQIVIGLFFGLAMLAASGRVLIRLWLQKRVRVDDYFLLASCACLITATGLLYHGIDTLFLGAALIINPYAVLDSGQRNVQELSRASNVYSLEWAYLAVIWMAIFAVKFGFLSLFRHLIDRLPRMIVFWKGVVIFTSISAAAAICEGFVNCPQVGNNVRKYLATNKART